MKNVFTRERERVIGCLWLVAYLRPYRWYFLLGLGALFSGSLLALTFPFLMGELIGASDGSGSWQRDEVAAFLATAIVIHAAVAYGRVLWVTKAGDLALSDLRSELFGHLLRLPLGFFDGHRVGEISSRMSSDLSLVRNTLVFTLPQVIGQAVIFLGGVVVLLVTSPGLSVYLFLCLPPVVLLVLFFGNRMRFLSREAQDDFAAAHVIVEESLQGVAGVKAFLKEDFESRRYHAAMKRYVDTIIRTAHSRGMFLGINILILFGTITLVAWIASGMLAEGETDIAEITRFALYSIFLGGVVASFPEAFGQLQRAIGATDRIREILSEAEEDPEPSHPSFAERGRLEGKVEVRDIRFRYPSRPDVEVLRGVSLHADPGERIALVGRSGSGKSTLLSLLMRLYLPDSGEILFDGASSDDLGSRYLRSRIAMVPQEVLLFGGTIFENIAYGKTGASAEEVEDAARRAYAHEFIEHLPEGYGTQVGERGVKLSGGQRQRIAIARAILADPAILILDEATSSLDAASEFLVRRALEELMKDRTSLIIAHRFSTVRDADRIYLLDEGRIAAAATHEQLIEDSELYRKLARLQFDEVTETIPETSPEREIDSQEAGEGGR